MAGNPAAQREQPQLVTAEVNEPYAVYFDGQHRTGTVPDVPADLATEWMRRGWVNYTWHH